MQYSVVKTQARLTLEVAAERLTHRLEPVAVVEVEVSASQAQD
jgi:hypothetical protein